LQMYYKNRRKIFLPIHQKRIFLVVGRLRERYYCFQIRRNNLRQLILSMTMYYTSFIIE